MRTQPRLLVAVCPTDVRPTPQWLFDSLYAEFGFTLDPCASPDNAKCDNYYTADDDGLTQSWQGHIVFCNPPYSETALWVEKALNESQGNCTIVMLLPASTDTRWFHDFVYNQAEVRFLKGRVTFEGQKNPAPFASMLVIFRGVTK